MLGSGAGGVQSPLRTPCEKRPVGKKRVMGNAFSEYRWNHSGQRLVLGAAFTLVLSSVPEVELSVRLLTGEPFIQTGIRRTMVELFPMRLQNA